MKHLEYNGYFGTVEPDFETNTLFGKLAYIRDTVTYEAETLSELAEEFQRSVDLYLEKSLIVLSRVLLIFGRVVSCIGLRY